MTFVLYFSFHELHVRSMQIYEKLILHLQIKIDFSVLLAERRAGLFSSTNSLNKYPVFPSK